MPWEVLVVDNDSNDSRSIAQHKVNRSPDFRLRHNKGQRAGGDTRCRGPGVAGELLAFADADDVVQPGWLTAQVLALGGGRPVRWCLRLVVTQWAGVSLPTLLRPAARRDFVRLSACGPLLFSTLIVIAGL